MNPAAAYLSKFPASSDSYRSMRSALKTVADVLTEEGEVSPGIDDFPWHELRWDALRSVAADLAEEDYSPRTINKCLSGLRGVLEAAWKGDLLPDVEYRKITIRNVKGTRLPAGRALSPVESAKLREGLDKVSPRDAAILAALRACGLRRVEVVRLTRESYDPRSGDLRALGKGDKERLVPVGPDWRKWLNAHWDRLDRGQRAFTSERGGPLSRRGVSYAVMEFCRVVEIAPPFTPHDLRRSFATDLLDAGADIGTVKELMGHCSLDTTGIYDRRGDARKRAAAGLIK